MSRCVFCRVSGGSFTTREHILPESLGGGEWAVLPAGLFCDNCQSRFGSEVEQQALGDYPFSFLRVFLGIPTKKGKPPWFKSWEGTVRASPRPSTLGYDPNLPFEQALAEGRKSQIRLLAHPMKPQMVCRFLLKMGIEVVAADSPGDALDERFDIARNYALTGEKPLRWWYLQQEDMSRASRWIACGVSAREWGEHVALEVVRLGQGEEVFHLRLLWLDVFTPLTGRVKPELDGLPEPEFRLFWV